MHNKKTLKTPIGIYVHIPFCKQRCSYCTFLSSCNLNLQNSYFEALIGEILRYAKQYPNTCVDTIYLGGGSPSVVDKIHLDALFKTLYKCFNVQTSAEITVECNVENLTPQKTACLLRNGANRVSLGLQSTDDTTLKTIGRSHNYSDFLHAVENLHNCGISNLSADLIIGLPESKQQFLTSAKEVSRLKLKHISMYALEIHPNTPLFKQIDSGKITVDTDSDNLCDMYDQAREIFENQGFLRYEVSNFSKTGFEARHNLKYWQNQNYFGFGAGAHGYLADTRYQNFSTIVKYIENSHKNNSVQSQEVLSNAQIAQEFVMLGLRLDIGISLDEFSILFKQDFFKTFESSDFLIKNGFLKQQNGRIFVPSDKMYVLNSILTELL